MSEDSMQGICSAMVADYAAITRYCETKRQGELSTLRSIIEGAFGHSDDTARDRISYLVNAKIIIIHGSKQWKFNAIGQQETIENIALLKSLRDSGESMPQNEEPSSLDNAKAISEYAKGKGAKK